MPILTNLKKQSWDLVFFFRTLSTMNNYLIDNNLDAFLKKKITYNKIHFLLVYSYEF